MDMFSNVPTNLILAGLVAVIALPFVVVACSVYVADRVIGALRPIYRLLREQAAASQRFATAIPATTSTVPPPQPTAAILVPPSTKMQREQDAVNQTPAKASAATSPAQTQAAAPAPGSAAADSNPDTPTEQHPTQHTEAELEAQRARIRQMIQGR
jgi:hypothetical protein